MCTYLTETLASEASGKGSGGWISIDETIVYYDHPVHLAKDHSLNIDFRSSKLGPSSRVAVELSKETARTLAETILRTLDTVGNL